MALYCIILEINRDIGQNSWFFHTPLYLTPPLGGSPSNYCLSVWFGKTIIMGLPDGEKKSDDMFTRFDRMYERDRHTHTDRRTDTACRQRPRLMQASHNKQIRNKYCCNSSDKVKLSDHVDVKESVSKSLRQRTTTGNSNMAGQTGSTYISGTMIQSTTPLTPDHGWRFGLVVTRWLRST